MPREFGAIFGVRAPAVAVALPCLAAGGCNAALWGNLFVVGVTVGIFFATLSLGRATLTKSQRSEGATQSTDRV